MTDTETGQRVAGGPVPAKEKVLETAARLAQDLTPVKSICAYLNAFHQYADDPSRKVEAQHYCAHISKVEYMITPRLYLGLEPSERRLWHSHVFEVKSGELIMPKPTGIPESVWEVAETKEMESIIQLYGKAYHLWQIDRGDKLPLGEPRLMMSCTENSPEIERLVSTRDEKFGTDHRRKAEVRSYIKEPKVHSDADQWDRGMLT